MPIDPSARWQVVPVPFKAPGKCFTCHGIANGPFIDTRIDHDFYLSSPNPEQDGNVYICTACIKGMFEALELNIGDLDSKIKTSYSTGVQDGVKMGSRLINEFAGSFSDVVGYRVGMPNSVYDISSADDAENEPAGHESSNEPVTDSSALDVFAGIEGRIDATDN